MCWFEGCNEVKVSSSVPTVEGFQSTCTIQLHKPALIHQCTCQKHPVVKLQAHLLNVPCMSGTVITGEIKEQYGMAPIVEELVLVKS